MRTAERLGNIVPEQYGSCKRHHVIDHAINKRLMYDQWRQFCHPGILVSNDAKSCYDRIVHSAASLSLQQQGAPLPPIQGMFTMIQQLRHLVQTAFGTSEQSFYGSNPEYPTPTHGVGQGNCAGPAIWTLLSSQLLQLQGRNGHGFYFPTPISRLNHFFAAFTFIDDTDIGQCMISPEDTPSDVLSHIQKGLIRWERLIAATGGALVPTKSFWYFIAFDWKHGKPIYHSIVDLPGTLTITTNKP